MPLQLDVHVRRGEVLESRHRFEVAAVDAAGELPAASAEPGLVTTFRSSAKPFQLLPLVERGHAERWGFSDEQLAVMAASHCGSPRHVALVRGILECIGAGPDDFACGFHEPDDSESLAAIRGGAAAPSPLYNNCSGKHAGMLALARAEGWPIEGYEKPGHPVQQLALRTVAELCGVAPESIRTAVDGCSVVVFALPLSAMARAYATFAAAAKDPGREARGLALARIARAMTSHAWAVGGEGRLTTVLMEAGDGRFVAKGGAEGLMLLGWIDRGLGLAIKCMDGSSRAMGPAVVAALAHIGGLDGLDPARFAALREPRLVNAAGLDVGSLQAVLHDIVHA